MDRRYAQYYINQSGNGIPVFSGIRYQRGHGFFGDSWNFLLNKILKPTSDYLLPKVIDTGKRIGSDILGGKNILKSLTENLGQTAEELLDDGVSRAKRFIQTGEGRRKRKKSSIKVAGSKKRKPLKRKVKKRKVVRKKKTTLKRRANKKKSFDNSKFFELFK